VSATARMARNVTPSVAAVSIALAALVVLAPGSSAHEVPADVTVQAFLRQEDSRVRLLVRVPLSAMRDVDIPTRGPGYLDLSRVETTLRNAATLWIAQSVEIYDESGRLPPPQIVAARVSLPSDRSFLTYDDALAHVTGPGLSEDTDLYWEQGLLDALLDYPSGPADANLSIRPGFERLALSVNTVLRFLPPGGAVRAFEFHGDPGVVPLDPRWHQAVLRFVQLGFLHILDGIDHLLFLACLVIPLRRLRPLVLVVTSFTVAHSITLVASAFGMAPTALWFPPLVETLIAASIVYMGLENIVSVLDTSGGEPRVARRWPIAFGFGLVHGFGFSFALGETWQFAGSHLLTSLVSFNLGVELGQLLVLGLLVPALALVVRYVMAVRTSVMVLSALVVHTGWHWMIERGDQLRQYRFQWPALDLMLLALLTRWLILIVIVAGLVWLGSEVLRRQAASSRLQNREKSG